MVKAAIFISRGHLTLWFSSIGFADDGFFVHGCIGFFRDTCTVQSVHIHDCSTWHVQIWQKMKPISRKCCVCIFSKKKPITQCLWTKNFRSYFNFVSLSLGKFSLGLEFLMALRSPPSVRPPGRRSRKVKSLEKRRISLIFFSLSYPYTHMQVCVCFLKGKNGQKPLLLLLFSPNMYVGCRLLQRYEPPPLDGAKSKRDFDFFSKRIVLGKFLLTYPYRGPHTGWQRWRFPKQHCTKERNREESFSKSTPKDSLSSPRNVKQPLEFPRQTFQKNFQDFFLLNNRNERQ